MPPRKIISGGQTGADRGGLDAAIELSIEHGGWAPLGRKAEDGTIPDKYQLQEAPSPDYRVRTEFNVRDSDMTILFVAKGGLFEDSGSYLTTRLAEAHGKFWVLYATFQDQATVVRSLRETLLEKKPEVLNVAGNRESRAPGIQQWTTEVLVAALAGLIYPVSFPGVHGTQFPSKEDFR